IGPAGAWELGGAGLGRAEPALPRCFFGPLPDPNPPPMNGLGTNLSEPKHCWVTSRGRAARFGGATSGARCGGCGRGVNLCADPPLATSTGSRSPEPPTAASVGLPWAEAQPRSASDNDQDRGRNQDLIAFSSVARWTREPGDRSGGARG